MADAGQGSQRINCIICGVDDARSVWSEHGLHVVQCRRCGLKYHNPVAAAESYDADYYADEVKTRKGGYFSTYVHAKDEGRLDEIARFKPGGRLLDVGCAFGFFIGHARDRGWDVAGVDVSEHSLSHARDTLGIENLNCGPLQDLGLPAGQFDVITCWDAVEHFPNPRVVVTEMHRLLKPDGFLVMEIPNEFSSLARIVWSIRNRRPPTPVTLPPTHLFFFDQKTIYTFLDICGFHVAHFRTTGFANPENPRPEILKRLFNRAAELSGRGTKMIVFAQKKQPR